MGLSRKAWTRVALLVGTPLVMLVLAEAGFRALKPRLGVDEARLAAYRKFTLHGFSTEYVPRPHTVFGRAPSLPGFNSLGFRGGEWPVERTPGVPRILCMGGSTTEGAAKGGPKSSFPALLEGLLEDAAGRDFEVFNCGTSAWDTSQSLVAFFLTAQDFRPDLLILHHAINDVPPRDRADFKSDYSHFWRPWSLRPAPWWKRFVVENSELASWIGMGRYLPNITSINSNPNIATTPFEAYGYLPIETAAAFRRNLESIGQRVESWGGNVLFLTMPLRPGGPDTAADRSAREGVAQHNQIMRDLAREHGWFLADAEAAFGEKPDEVAPLYVDLCHVVKAGNVLKAQVILNALAEVSLHDPDKLPFRWNE